MHMQVLIACMCLIVGTQRQIEIQWVPTIDLPLFCNQNILISYFNCCFTVIFNQQKCIVVGAALVPVLIS